MVEKKKNAIAIRCHQIGEAEKKLYSFVAEYFGKENTFFVMNVDPSTVKVLKDIITSFLITNNTTVSSLFEQVSLEMRDLLPAMFNALAGVRIFGYRPDIKFCCDKAETFFEDFETQRQIF